MNKDKRAFLYKTENTINGDYYIGVRTYTGTNQDNTYLGSGKYLKSAIKSYGKENFKRTILLISTAGYCYEVERKIVTEEFVKDRSTYNISVGGWGGDRGVEARAGISKAQQKIAANRTPEERESRRQFLISINDPSSMPTGEDASGWKGYWLTPVGTFITCREAAKQNNIDHRTLRSRCRDNNSKVITKPGLHLPQSWKGNTWYELGWGFTPKEVKGE